MDFLFELPKMSS